MKALLFVSALLTTSVASAEDFSLAQTEQQVVVAHTNMNMDINLSVILNGKSIDLIHIKGKAYDEKYETSKLKEGIVILNFGSDLVKLQSDNFMPLTGGNINMEYLKDKRAGKWETSEFRAGYNQAGKVALYQNNGFKECEVDYLTFDFAKNAIGIPKGVNSIVGTCLPEFDWTIKTLNY
jgi:hypothetical protein